MWRFLQFVGEVIGELAGRAMESRRTRARIAYSREPDTRRWIAELDGHRAVADTRPEAGRRVLWMRAGGRD